MASAVDLSINTHASALAMAQSMFGNGIAFVDAKYSGDCLSSGVCSGALNSIPGISPTDSRVILSTGYATSFTSGGFLLPTTNTNVDGNTSTDTWGVDGHAPLQTLDGAHIYDAAIFEANFIHDTNFLTMQFVFSSEEYLEYVKTGFNDAFGVWVNGSFAPFAITGNGHVAIDTVNPTLNSTLYVDNPSSLDLYNTETDGFAVTLNAAGTLTILADQDVGAQSFSYAVKDAVGNTDVGFVTVTTTAVPCFVAGTPIATDTGARAIETLRPGDLVATCDHGLQPLRWIGVADHHASGKAAPVRLMPGALGDHGEVWLSQNHRVMLSWFWAELMFGESEVLVQAKELVNGHSIRILADGRSITYVHLRFGQHEIVTTAGLDSESHHPGCQTIEGFDARTRDGSLALMPNSDVRTGFGYGPAARTSLRHPEAVALMSRLASQPRNQPAIKMARAA